MLIMDELVINGILIFLECIFVCIFLEIVKKKKREGYGGEIK